jgi:hypothetical protein
MEVVERNERKKEKARRVELVRRVRELLEMEMMGEMEGMRVWMVAAEEDWRRMERMEVRSEEGKGATAQRRISDKARGTTRDPTTTLDALPSSCTMLTRLSSSC